jgi:hypothetical protein
MGQDRRRYAHGDQTTGRGDPILLGRIAGRQGLHQVVQINLGHFIPPAIERIGQVSLPTLNERTGQIDWAAGRLGDFLE